MVEVRLQCDYGLRWPVWFFNDVLDDREITPLTDAVKSEAEDWAQYFIRFFDHEKGWPSQRHANEFADQGRRLQTRMQDELGPGFKVNLVLD